ncbi:hypothetical protein [Aureispira anguillae]|uniref:Uncharacterized protein n=1 Tax=Aureispira anguillae TaxID=2864201 RepID=A0A915YDB9_9BACT|nr:hypothetical protein [Aureispira anguillae]BDS10951.1 hypothetical protein AsAng_0016610 [Aureispira anguillae]
MTTFTKNPYAEMRKKINRIVFRDRLDKTLDGKFKHKRFSERFALANTAFIGMSGIAQLASMGTAFVMLSYLFESSPMLIRVIFSAALVSMIEVVKREATNDVMKSLNQYKEVEKFPTFLALLMVGTSIYISIEGAKILPSLFIADVMELLPEEKEAEAVKAIYDTKIETLTKERENYIQTRLYHGRIRTEDSKEVMRINERIALTEHKKDSALQVLDKKNEAAQAATLLQNKAAKVAVEKERMKLGEQLVIAAIGFEILFLFSLCFSWWYYTECEKERQKAKENSSPSSDPENMPKVDKEIPAEEAKVLEVETIGVRATKKVSFKDYEQEENLTETEKVKKDYTRICAHCDSPFIHKTHNHKYCSRACMVAAREQRKANQ